MTRKEVEQLQSNVQGAAVVGATQPTNARPEQPVEAVARPKAMKRQQISLGIMRRDLLNCIWLRPESFQVVNDAGDHLECQEAGTGEWYWLEMRKMEKI